MPAITQWSNVQPLSGVAVRSSEAALANAYVPGAGLTVPPTPAKITTIASVADVGAVAGGIYIIGVNIACKV